MPWKCANSCQRPYAFPCSSVFVGSTGVIGRPLPMPVIRQATPPLTRLLSRSGHKPAAQAIMTTDTIHKEIACRQRSAGGF